MPRRPIFGDVPCLICGTLFRKLHGGMRFCSLPCSGIWHRGRPRIPHITATCETCGTGFTYPSNGKKRRRFCSMPCAQKGHRAAVTKDEIVERFWANVDKRGPDECWNWLLTPGAPGYGLLTIGRHFKRAAHRVSYELHHGEIPVLEGSHGGCVLHKCDNRRCVNPEHLFVGSQRDNIHDMINKGRHNWDGLS